MHYITSERIKVGVIYGEKTRMKPVWFIWNGKKYHVTKVNHVWKDKDGREVLVFFSVSDEANTYLLCYNTLQMEWTICGTYTEG